MKAFSERKSSPKTKKLEGGRTGREGSGREDGEGGRTVREGGRSGREDGVTDDGPVLIFVDIYPQMFENLWIRRPEKKVLFRKFVDMPENLWIRIHNFF